MTINIGKVQLNQELMDMFAKINNGQLTKSNFIDRMKRLINKNGTDYVGMQWTSLLKTLTPTAQKRISEFVS